MMNSPIKFDDLAFILLFFFMIIAVISFSNTMNVNTQKTTDEESENISVYLDKNGNLSQNSFNTGDSVDLSIAPETDWYLVQNAVRIISSQEANVTLVIE